MEANNEEDNGDEDIIYPEEEAVPEEEIVNLEKEPDITNRKSLHEFEPINPEKGKTDKNNEDIGSIIYDVNDRSPKDKPLVDHPNPEVQEIAQEVIPQVILEPEHQELENGKEGDPVKNEELPVKASSIPIIAKENWLQPKEIQLKIPQEDTKSQKEHLVKEEELPVEKKSIPKISNDNWLQLPFNIPHEDPKSPKEHFIKKVALPVEKTSIPRKANENLLQSKGAHLNIPHEDPNSPKENFIKRVALPVEKTSIPRKANENLLQSKGAHLNIPQEDTKSPKEHLVKQEELPVETASTPRIVNENCPQPKESHLNIPHEDTKSSKEHLKEIPPENSYYKNSEDTALLASKALLYNLDLDIDEGFLVEEEAFKGLQDEDLFANEDTFNRVNKIVQKSHPYIESDGKISEYPVCGTDVMNIGCGQCCARSELEGLGLGMVIYFKILKAFSVVFFFIIYFNGLLYYIYTSNHKDKPLQGYIDALFRTTIGNVGSVLYNCERFPVSTIYSSKVDRIQLTMNCNDYIISAITHFGLTQDYNMATNNTMYCQNFSSLTGITTDSGCEFEEFVNTIAANNSCFSQEKKCSFILPLDEIKKNCSSNPKYEYFYFSYTCHDNWVQLSTMKISRDIFPFIAVGIDLAGILCLLVLLIIIPIAQQNTKKLFMEQIIQISDYTIHFSSLNFSSETLYQDLNEFINHIHKVTQHEFPKEDKHVIYDIVYPFVTDSKIDLAKEANRIHRAIAKLESNDIKNIDELSLQRQKMQKISDEIKRSEKELKRIDHLYVTFTNQKYRNRLSRLYSSDRCDRCCIICTCKRDTIKHLYFRNKWLDFESATDQPSNIIWENVQYSRCKRFLRVLISIFLAILVLALPFGLVIGSRYAENEINQVFNTNIDCSQIEYTKAQVEEEFKEASIIMRNKVKTHCYCLDQVVAIGPLKAMDLSFDESTFPCNKWAYLYTQSTGLVIAVIIVVPISNIILSGLLTILTDFERNKTITENLTSNMWKLFILEFINTGVILLIVNMSIEQVKTWDAFFPFFTGRYKDVSPDWYSKVGATIAFYMLINIFSSHVVTIIKVLWHKIKICCDRRCCNKTGKETKTKTKKEYIDLYTGPEFNVGQRYSEILTTIAVVLIYSSGIPIMYVFCFLYLFFTYWVDKWLIFRFYKTPPRIDLYLDSIFTIYIMLAILLHLGFGIWMYGNQDILTSNTNAFFTSIKVSISNLFNLSSDSFYSYALERVTYSHNLIMLGFLLFVFLIFIWRTILWRLFCKRGKCCVANENKIQKVDIYSAMKTESIYYNYQLRKAFFQKFVKSGERADILKDEFYEYMILKDREQIKAKITTFTGIDLSNITNHNFDLIMKDVMKKWKEEGKEGKVPLNGESTYHFAENVNYHDIAFYYLFLPAKSRIQNGSVIK